jgi:murein L,D-transpeptidase YafK
LSSNHTNRRLQQFPRAITAVLGLLVVFGFSQNSSTPFHAVVPPQAEADTSYSTTTAPQTRDSLTLPLKSPRIVVWKSKRRLDLYSTDKLVRSYKVGLGLSPVYDKERQGDRRTPEGDFYIFTKNNKSAFYLSLGISYPNAEDAERGLRDGLISRRQRDAIIRSISRKATPPQNTRLGGDIYIHGNGASTDWTWGCVALENADIKGLFDAVAEGTPVTIKP